LIAFRRTKNSGREPDRRRTFPANKQSEEGEIIMSNQYSNVPAPSDDPFERYAAGDPGLQFGDLLKHNGKTGGWSCGIGNNPIEIGTPFVVIYEAAYVGFVKWVDGTANRVLVPLHSDPDLHTLRESLGDLDQNLWLDRSAEGKPRDPWRPAVVMPFVEPESIDGCFTFSTSSDGGVKASRHLIRVCAAKKRASPEMRDRLPLAEVGERSYQHPDRKFGTLYNPTFKLVDWVPTSTIAEILQLVGVEVPAIEHARETIHEIVEDQPNDAKSTKQKVPKAKHKPTLWNDDDEPDVRADPYEDD
jgi:hypothetical protein